MTDKLIIPQNKDGDQTTTVIRLSRKAFALIDQLSRKSGRSKSDVASRMIEWAYDHTEVEDPPEITED